MNAKRTLGTAGESRAAAVLAADGYRILDRNWRCPIGEVDLVASHHGDLVIVEVKTRSSLAFGHPFEAVTGAKLGRLGRLGSAWRLAHPDVRAGRIRIDLVAVVGEDPATAAVSILRGVR